MVEVMFKFLLGVHQKVQEALDDPSQPLPADQVFAELRAHHAGRRKAGRDAL